VVEIARFLAMFAAMGVLKWQFLIWLVPSWYIGHSFSYLNGYFEHYAGNPDKPIAWGVSTYHKLYNWTWFNNRHHAEHHHRPRQHWTKMRDLHLSIQEEQEKEGTHVIRPPYALGFFDPDLPPLGKPVPVFKKGGAAEVA
jgi:fatty acid desaturase